MNFPFLLLWVCMFSIPVIAFLLSQITFFSKTRIFLNCVILFVAFLFNLMDISFASDIADIGFLYIIVTIVMKFTCSALKMHGNLFKYVIFLGGIAIYVVQFGDWIVRGPQMVFENRIPVVVHNYNFANQGYYVKEYRGSNVQRMFTFYRNASIQGLEKMLDKYSVPPEYEIAEFSIKWNTHNMQAPVVIIGDRDTLWTLKVVK